jgi:sulfur carrier protein
MVIKVNGEEKSIEKEDVTINELLTICDVEMPDMVSVQVNGEFVNREDYQKTSVNDGTEVDFLYFMGGGK